MYKNIVVAYDGSENSAAALKEGIGMSRACVAKLTIVNAVDITEEFESEAPGLTEKMEEKAREMVEKAAREAEGLDVTTEVHVGDSADVIVEVAQKKGADIIIVGTHGRTGLKRLILGSVASKVIGHAPCNVLVVRHG
jgi:nucleotide-binding universal stress UspA family protein